MRMGSGNYTFEEAANRLGRSKRQVHNYVKSGFIRKVLESGQAVLVREDVELVAIDLGSDMPAMNRKTFLHLTSRVKRLEEEMITVKHILEIRDAPMRPSADEARGVHAAACESLARGVWAVDEIHLWAHQFDRMDEVALDMIRDAINEPKPWLVFYELCIALMKTVPPASGLESAALHRKLDEGRKKMRSTVVMWVEMGRGSVTDNVFRLVDSGKESVLRRASNKG